MGENAMAKLPIGLDVGSSTVRAVQVKVSRDKPSIVKAAEIPLAPGIIVNGEIREPDALSDAIRSLWKIGKFSSKDAVIAVGGSQTIVRQTDLPWEPDDEFRALLPLRIGQDLPVNAMEMGLDFYGLEDYTEPNGSRKKRALLVGATNIALEQLAETATAAGIRPVGIDFSGFALIRAAVHTYGNPKYVPGAPNPDMEFPCEVIIDIGAHTTTLIAHYQGRPLFVRMIEQGGESVDRAISDHLKLRADVSEALKMRLGIAGVGEVDPAALRITADVPEQSIQVARQIVTLMASSLVQSVRESVDYFLAATPQVSGVSRILLSGGSALLGGYGERVSAELRAPAALLAPMTEFSRKGKLASMDPRFGIAFGLTMGVK